jgi:hypothetical protein
MSQLLAVLLLPIIHCEEKTLPYQLLPGQEHQTQQHMMACGIETAFLLAKNNVLICFTDF